jgi:Acyclic terpene utilisation family protein AtuA
MKTLRIGAGAGYSGDRIEPAVELAEKGDIRYLIFECLAERTIALAQQEKLRDPERGYDPLLEARMHAVLGICLSKGIKIITNMGAANPRAATARTATIARALGLRAKIAAVTGDDVLDRCRDLIHSLIDAPGAPSLLAKRIVSANAYLGAEPIVEALAGGADVVITGRTADPSLFVAPLIKEFGWAMDDWDRLGRGTLVGHLLECAGQVTGGYFADPGFKDMAGLDRLGFPIAEVEENGDAVITKVKGSGGAVTSATCKEQLLYELHDPSSYVQPDVIADFSQTVVEEIGPDLVKVSRARGKPRPREFKVSIGYSDGYIGEGQISYGGPGAVQRARLALDIVRERLALTGVQMEESRFDLIGIDALHGAKLSSASGPYEVRLRVAGRTASLAEALRIGNEVETLYTNGPAGGGGVVKLAREILAVASALLDRELVNPAVSYVET